MSPMVDATATGEGRQQSRENAGRERADAQGKDSKLKRPKGDLFVGLIKRIYRVEASQEEKEGLIGIEASVFVSFLGRGKPMSREVLDIMPPRRVSPRVSPNTCLDLHQHGYAGAAANVEMA